MFKRPLERFESIAASLPTSANGLNVQLAALLAQSMIEIK